MTQGYVSRLRQFLELSLQIAISEFKLRNEGSYLGIFWYLLNPILSFFLLLFIFKNKLGTQINFYEIYILIGIILFNFFQSSTLEATRSLIREHRALIKSINFPRESLIVGIVLKNLFSHFFEILLLILFLIYFKLPILRLFYYLPVLIFFLMFILGTAFILSTLTVYFVDMENIWNFLVRLIWIGTPIFYSIESQTKLFFLNLFNPMYYFISATRALILGSRLEGWLIFGLILFGMSFFIFGLFFFKKLKNKIAEMI